MDIVNTTNVNGRVFVSDRTNPNVGAGFAPFRSALGPLSNPAIAFTNPTGIPDCYAINELWKGPGFNEVYRALLTPGFIPAPGGGTRPNGAGQGFAIQDRFGNWLGMQQRNLLVNQQIATNTQWPAPSLMSVGNASRAVFACVLARSEDDQVTTTWLAGISPVLDSSAQVTGVGFSRVQDLLNGDDRFVPGLGAPLAPPPSGPPAPRVSGPGDPIRSVDGLWSANHGAVRCAMTQLGSDATTRTLHMLAIKGGELFHSAASDWGSVTQLNVLGESSQFDRFRAVSPWENVPVALGGGFGEITSAAEVALGPTLHVFFVAKKNNVHKLFHTARFSNGTWHQAVDVLAESGDAPAGNVYAFQIAAGICPQPGDTSFDMQQAEIVVAMFGFSDNGVYTLSHVPSARVWVSGRPASNYSPMSPIPSGEYVVAPIPRFFPLAVSVGARPFPDGPTPNPSPSPTP